MEPAEKVRQPNPPGSTDTASAGRAAPTEAPPAPAAHYHPILLNAHAAKGSKEARMSHLGLNFNLTSFFSYYPMLRLMGYSFEAAYSPINRTLQKWHLSGLDALKHGTKLEELSRAQRWAYGHYGDKPLEKMLPAEKSQRNAASEQLFVKQIDFGVEKDFGASEKRGDESSKMYKHQFNRVEAAAFTGLAVWHSWQSAQQLKDSFKLAVATEFGKDPKDVSFSDLRRSNNPLVVSAMDRLLWQAPTRALAGAAFLPALWAGIMANSLVITLERTIFYRPIAYDLLSKAVNDVQINNLGTEAKGEVVDNLIRTLQAERFDHRQANIPREQVEGLRPVLEMVADDIINKRFGITGLMYIMGGGVLIPEDPQQSLINYQHVRDVGVSGIMEEARKIKAQNKVPSTKIWDAELMDKPRSKHDGEQNIAESARRDELLRERRAILARGPLHSAPGSGVDPDARYGTVQMY